MPRLLKVAAAQVGAIHRKTPRKEVLDRLINLLDQAAFQNVQLVVFPETTFTTFFPRYIIRDSVELDSYFEEEDELNGGIVESKNVKPFFDHAKKLHIEVVIGYAEKTTAGESYNTATWVGGEGTVVGKYRKIHLPGTLEPFDEEPLTTNQLEKRYFTPGNLGFPAFRLPSLIPKDAQGNPSPGGSPIGGMLICNDRRWAEGWRCLGLQGVEIVAIGYNTTAYAPQLLGSREGITKEESRAEAMFHHKLSCQGHAYTNSTFCITSARAGFDDDHFELIAGTMIVDPQGHIVNESKTLGDELVVAEIDLDQCLAGKQRTFCFEKHRRPEHYTRLIEQKGVIVPPEVI